MVLKAAVIGVGNMGRNHARVYSELDDCELVCVSDVDKKRGAEVAKELSCEYVADYKELIRRSPDIISVCVPTRLHYKIAVDVINAGKHILIEKPIASTSKEAADIVRLAAENCVKLTVGHVERFNPAVIKLKEIIDSGRLGDVTSLLARRVGLFPPQIDDSNVIIDLAVHDIDIFNYLLGRLPSSIYAKGGKGIIKSREDYAGIFLTYGKANAIIEVNWITPTKIRMLDVTGTKGYASLNYITQDLVLYDNVYEKEYDKFGDFILKFGSPKKTVVSIKKEEPLKAEIMHFINCVKNDTTPLVTGVDGINALDIAIKSKESL